MIQKTIQIRKIHWIDKENIPELVNKVFQKLKAQVQAQEQAQRSKYIVFEIHNGNACFLKYFSYENNGLTLNFYEYQKNYAYPSLNTDVDDTSKYGTEKQASAGNDYDYVLRQTIIRIEKGLIFAIGHKERYSDKNATELLIGLIRHLNFDKVYTQFALTKFSNQEIIHKIDQEGVSEIKFNIARMLPTNASVDGRLKGIISKINEWHMSDEQVERKAGEAMDLSISLKTGRAWNDENMRDFSVELAQNTLKEEDECNFIIKTKRNTLISNDKIVIKDFGEFAENNGLIDFISAKGQLLKASNSTHEKLNTSL